MPQYLRNLSIRILTATLGLIQVHSRDISKYLRHVRLRADAKDMTVNSTGQSLPSLSLKGSFSNSYRI